MSHQPTILGIDPGTTESGWCLLTPENTVEAGISPNDKLLYAIQTMPADVMACEIFEARGMPIGNESIETIIFTGRLIQAWGGKFARVKRSEVKRNLCGSLKAKDSNVRQAIIDLFGGSSAIGKKANPGPLYGVSSHAWAALGVALTARESL